MKYSTAIIAGFAVAFTVASPAMADAIVISNRDKEPVSFQITADEDRRTAHELQPGELMSLPVKKPLDLRYGEAASAETVSIDPNSVCFFFRDDAQALHLNRIGFAGEPDNATPAAEPAQTAEEDNLDGLCKIPVKILVDDEEPFTQKLWEERLRERVQRASDILEQHCRARLEIVAVDRWDSDDDVLEFPKMLAEFEREAPVDKAALAIGFSSQRRIIQPRTHLGGTFAPLRQHILIREWSRTMNEAERLEVLLHELGHYLGATHSPEANSAMRPILNDGKATLKSFRLGYDPVNTLIMCLVAEEIRDRNVRQLHQLTPRARRQLSSIYREIAKITPDEPATMKIMHLLEQGTPPRKTGAAATTPR